MKKRYYVERDPGYVDMPPCAIIRDRVAKTEGGFDDIVCTVFPPYPKRAGAMRRAKLMAKALNDDEK